VAPWRSYHVSVTVRAPLPFAFRWCTDYSPDDARYCGEDRTIHLKRKIIERRPRRVVFENVYDVGKGWGWERHTVTLYPPNRWHSDGVGNYQESVLDYELTPLGAGRTRLDMRWRSRPVGLSRGSRTPGEVIERYVSGLWKKRARALAADYRASQAKS